MIQINQDILNLSIHGYKNFSATELGLDSMHQCLNKEHFINFHYKVNYNFNELGYREFSIKKYNLNPIIAIGDSFTLGLGLPIELTYPKQLEKLLNYQVLNFSLNGASNDWISRKLEQILNYFNPKSIIVHYTFTHRRESNRNDWTDDERTLCPLKSINEEEDYNNFLSNHEKIKKLVCNIPTVFSTIPRYHHINTFNMYTPTILDFARDYFHYGEKTCLAMAKTFSDLIKL